MSNKISEEDIADFRKHVESGNSSSAKMILYRVSRAQTPSKAAQVVPLDKAKTDFLKYFKLGNLKFCASILQQHPELVMKSSDEIQKIMTENKSNNELNFTENHYQEEKTKRKVSESESELDDFELVEGPKASNGNHEASESETKDNVTMHKLEQADLDILREELDNLDISHPSSELER